MKYRCVELDDGSIRCIPVSEDPLQSLRDAPTEELGEASIEELQSAVVAEARRQSLAETYRGKRWKEDE